VTAQEARVLVGKYQRLATFWAHVETSEQSMRVKLSEVHDDDELVVIFMEDVMARMLRKTNPYIAYQLREGAE
jgi:hypothetical protein